MHDISISTMKDLIKHVCFRLNGVVGILGPSGCGKSEGAEQATLEEGAIYLPVLLGQYDTVDLKGTPWVREHANGYQDTVWHPASTLPFKGNPAFDEDGSLIHVHFDEVNHATPPVLGVCYQIMQSSPRRLGEHLFMDNVRVSCSGNRASDKGISNRMPSPLDNRIDWAEVQPNVADWSKHAQSIGVSPVGIAYLNWQKDKLMTFDPAKPEKAYGTGRSWVRALRYYADTTMSQSLKEVAMAGAVGSGNAAMFWAFVEHWEKVTKLMPRILKEPAKADVPEEPAMQYAIALSISGSLDLKNVDPYDVYLSRMPSEFRVMAWNLATARSEKLFDAAAFVRFSKENKAIWG